MNALITAARNTSALLSEAGMTVLIGFCVVFVALLLLTIVFWVFGVVARGKEQTQAPEKKAVAQPAQKTTKVPPVVEDDIPEEIVAVIAAAIAAMSDGETQYTVRRIRSARTNARPVWAAAGIAENTQPF